MIYIYIYIHTSYIYIYIYKILYIVGHKLTSWADEWTANINDDTAMVNFMVDVETWVDYWYNKSIRLTCCWCWNVFYDYYWLLCFSLSFGGCMPLLLDCCKIALHHERWVRLLTQMFRSSIDFLRRSGWHVMPLLPKNRQGTPSVSKKCRNIRK